MGVSITMKGFTFAFALMGGACYAVGLVDEDGSLVCAGFCAGILGLLFHWYGDWKEMRKEQSRWRG